MPTNCRNVGAYLCLVNFCVHYNSSRKAHRHDSFSKSWRNAIPHVTIFASAQSERVGACGGIIDAGDFRLTEIIGKPQEK